MATKFRIFPRFQNSGIRKKIPDFKRYGLASLRRLRRYSVWGHLRPATILEVRFYYENFMNKLIKRNLGKIALFLLLLWGIVMAFGLPQIAAAVFFCAVIVPTANVTLGKKYAIPMAVLGVVWLVISIFIM